MLQRSRKQRLRRDLPQFEVVSAPPLSADYGRFAGLIPMLVMHATRIQSLVIVVVAALISGCANPSSPSKATFTLAGIIRDSSLRPLADAMIQVTSGTLAGQVTTSNALGQFQFADTASVTVPTILVVVKAGYFPATVQVERTDIVVTLTSSRFPVEGDYTITFTAADECSMLPSSLRRRIYSSTIDIWQRFDVPPLGGFFAIGLTESDFFPELRTLSLSLRGNRGNFFISSFEAQERWGDDVPIYERLGATEYLSLHGTATTVMSVTDTAFATTFDGIMSYCPKSFDPLGRGSPPRCAAIAIDCHSSRHELTGSRR